MESLMSMNKSRWRWTLRRSRAPRKQLLAALRQIRRKRNRNSLLHNGQCQRLVRKWEDIILSWIRFRSRLETRWQRAVVVSPQSLMHQYLAYKGASRMLSRDGSQAIRTMMIKRIWLREFQTRTDLYPNMMMESVRIPILLCLQIWQSPWSLVLQPLLE